MVAFQDRGWWEKPVPVELGVIGQTYHINSNVQAGEVLLNRWPVDGGPKLMAARRAVLKALDRAGDRRAAASARRAFEAAADEAGILVKR